MQAADLALMGHPVRVGAVARAHGAVAVSFGHTFSSVHKVLVQVLSLLQWWDGAELCAAVVSTVAAMAT